MNTRICIIAMLSVLAGCARHMEHSTFHQRERSTPRTSIVAPLVDHHQHLLSPETADEVAPPPLTGVALPEDIARLLRLREQSWNEESALKKLYTDDSLVMGLQSPGWLRGAGAAAKYLSTRFSGPYHFTPAIYRGRDAHAQIAGYLTRGVGNSAAHFANVFLDLERRDDGIWRIRVENHAFPGPVRDLSPRSATELVESLDVAGVKRAVVLSDAFFFPSRSVDAPAGELSSERWKKVRAENDWVLQNAALFPNRLIAFCSFSPLEEYALIELQYCAARGFRGLKLHLDESRVDLDNPEHVSKVIKVFSLSNRLRLPIVVHVGNNQGSAEETRRNIATFLQKIVPSAPDVVVQVAHLWGGQQYSDAALMAYSNSINSPAMKNVYFDLAEVARMILLLPDADAERARNTIVKQIRRIGIQRMLFGSDDHLPPREAWLSFKKEVPLSVEEQDVIARNVAPYLR